VPHALLTSFKKATGVSKYIPSRPAYEITKVLPNIGLKATFIAGKAQENQKGMKLNRIHQVWPMLMITQWQKTDTIIKHRSSIRR
jgi:hypothetical protein